MYSKKCKIIEDIKKDIEDLNLKIQRKYEYDIFSDEVKYEIKSDLEKFNQNLELKDYPTIIFNMEIDRSNINISVEKLRVKTAFGIKEMTIDEYLK